MSKNPNRKTNCAACAYRGPRVHVNRQVYQTCLRHRLDEEPHVLPQEWLDALALGEVTCDLFKRAAPYGVPTEGTGTKEAA